MAAPLGPVCLQIRLPNGRLLPVRQATSLDEDTARFQYEEWGRSAAARAQKENIEARRSSIRTALSTQSAAVKTQDEINTRKGWVSEQACNNVTGGIVEIHRSERPVASPSEQDRVARMMCIIRLDNGGQHVATAKSPSQLTHYLERLDPAVRDRWIELRGQQIKQFVDDWKSLSPEIAAFKERYRIPHFGSYSDVLFLQSLTIDAGHAAREAIKASREPRPQDILGYVGGSVEAYDRCIRDGKQQVDLNYRQAQALKADLSTLPERLRLQAAQECREAVTKLDNMRSRLAGFEQGLAAAERELNLLTVTPLAVKSRDLNSIACVP